MEWLVNNELEWIWKEMVLPQCKKITRPLLGRISKTIKPPWEFSAPQSKFESDNSRIYVANITAWVRVFGQQKFMLVVNLLWQDNVHDPFNMPKVSAVGSTSVFTWYVDVTVTCIFIAVHSSVLLLESGTKPGTFHHYSNYHSPVCVMTTCCLRTEIE
jgi:hypothetical protein